MYNSTRKTARSFSYALKGLAFLWKREHNFRFHLFAAGLVLMAGFYFDITRTDWMLCITMLGLVTGAEALNTAIEKLADHVCPDHHPAIGTIKDVAAAGVMLISLAAMAIGFMVFGPLIWALL